MKKIKCKARAEEWVHWYATGGAALAVVPIPIATTLALGAAETTMIYWIARIYGEQLNKTDLVTIAAGLELGGFVFKAAAIEASNFVPIAGPVIKAAIAAGVIEGIGNAIIKHYDDKYPNRLYTADPEIENPKASKRAS